MGGVEVQVSARNFKLDPQLFDNIFDQIYAPIKIRLAVVCAKITVAHSDAVRWSYANDFQVPVANCPQAAFSQLW